MGRLYLRQRDELLVQADLTVEPVKSVLPEPAGLHEFQLSVESVLKSLPLEGTQEQDHFHQNLRRTLEEDFLAEEEDPAIRVHLQVLLEL